MTKEGEPTRRNNPTGFYLGIGIRAADQSHVHAKLLLDDIVEEAVGVLGLDLLLNPPVGGEVSNVDLVGRACATGEDSEDATIPGEDDGPGVTGIGKLAMLLVVGQDGDLDGGVLDAVVIVGAGE